MQEKMKQVEKLRSTGVSAKEACEKVGIGYSTYGYYRTRANIAKKGQKRRGRPTKKAPKITEFTTLEAPKRAKMVVFMGSPMDVQEALRGLL
jgi:transposase